MTWALESYKKLKTEQLTGLPLFKQRGQTRRASNGQASATSIGQSGHGQASATSLGLLKVNEKMSKILEQPLLSLIF